MFDHSKYTKYNELIGNVLELCMRPLVYPALDSGFILYSDDVLEDFGVLGPVHIKDL